MNVLVNVNVNEQCSRPETPILPTRFHEDPYTGWYGVGALGATEKHLQEIRTLKEDLSRKAVSIGPGGYLRYVSDFLSA